MLDHFHKNIDKLARHAFLIVCLASTPLYVYAHPQTSTQAEHTFSLKKDALALNQKPANARANPLSVGNLLTRSLGKTHTPANSLIVNTLVPQTGVSILFLYPQKFQTHAKLASNTLRTFHQQMTQVLGNAPSFAVGVRLLEEEEFFNLTGAPRWTNALFYRKQVLLPISENTQVQGHELIRSLRHEYAHALINAHSSGKAPGWIDEGLAQIFEGDEHPGLRIALFNWLDNNPAIPLSSLQLGFTKLDSKMVAAAYAQSLFASKLLVGSFNNLSLRDYFSSLRIGIDNKVAFSEAFGISEEQFEKILTHELDSWYQRAKTHVQLNNISK